MAGPFISFLTDFGADTAPATCRGVMWGIAPDARILDLTHSVRAFSVRDGAFLLWSSVPYLPVGVHVAVVDPGVGTPRRPIAIRAARGDLLVGPDNGLLVPAAARLGGIVEARVLTNRTLWRDDVSTTFHGRDIFSPVAAHLANGVDLTTVGEPIDGAALVQLAFPAATARDGGLDSSVLFIDAFGNCRLAGEPRDLEAAIGRPLAGGRLSLRHGGTATEVPWCVSFGVVAAGELLAYEDADYAGLAVAVNQGSAAERLHLTLDDPVRIEAA